MKKISLSLLLAACSLAGMSQTIGDAFYIYRNDGHFNAFIRDEVDSIAFSYYDADSLYYEDIVTQLVYTQDSVYLIPLAAIDSVSFVTPETKYQPSVIVIEGELRDYVQSSEDLTIRFRSAIPSSLLPRVGDKLVTTEVSETFFAGFLGLVESVVSDGDSYVVTCSSVALEEVFEYFYYVSGEDNGAMQVNGERRLRRIDKTWEGSFSPGTINIPFSAPLAAQYKPDPQGDLAFEVGEIRANLSVTPTYRGRVFMAVSPRLGTLISIDLSEEDLVTQNLAFSGAIDWTHDISPGGIPIFSLGVPFLYFYGDIGLFVRARGTLSVDAQWRQTLRYSFHYEVGSKSFYIPRVSYYVGRTEFAQGGEALVKGELGVGIFAELGVAFMAKHILSAGGRAELGVKVGGEAMLYKEDMETSLRSTDTYKRLQSSDVYLKGFWNVGLQAQWLHWGVSHSFEALSGEREIARFGIVPTFSEVKLTRDKDVRSTLLASAKASGRCFSQDLGFTLFEQETEEEGETSYSWLNYSGASSNKYTSYFTGQSQEKKYEAYPTVKLFGVEMLAEPKAEEDEETLCPDGNHPHMIDMGLPSGTKWACCNVGASALEGYGNYYAWGETTPKSTYNWDTYKYGGYDADGNWKMTKYNKDSYYGGVDNKTVLDLSDDAARANWGSSWRMATIEEWHELINNCTWTWTVQNGVIGFKVVGTNGGTVFLPAAGYRYGTYLDLAGDFGYYWSSSLRAGSPGYAWRVDFGSGYVDDWSGRRCDGRSVRPVCRP